MRERVVIGVGILLHPFADRDETLRSLQHLVDIVDWVLPERAELLVDMTGAHDDGDLAWWVTRLAESQRARADRDAHCIDRVRCTWLVAPDHSIVAAPISDRVREIVVPLDQPADWAELERALREYAARISVDELDASDPS